MSLFHRSLCLFLGVCCAATLIFSDAMAKKDKRPKNEKPPVIEVMPDEKLMGLGKDQALALLGAPSFKRSENGAEVWQYAQGGCVLNVFLFEKPPEPGIRVQYLDVFAVHPQPGVNAAEERQGCLRIFTDHSTPVSTPPAK